MVRRDSLVVVRALLLSPFSLCVNAVPQTVYVDDRTGDSLTGAQVSFLPSEAGFSEGPLCSGCRDTWCQGCALAPDPNKAYGGTWRVATQLQGDATAKYLQFDFVGAYPCISGVKYL